MAAFLPLAVRVMLLLRPSNNQFGAPPSSPFPEEPRIVPADAIVAAQSTVNASRANLVPIRFNVIFSPHTKVDLYLPAPSLMDVQGIAGKGTIHVEENLMPFAIWSQPCGP